MEQMTYICNAFLIIADYNKDNKLIQKSAKITDHFTRRKLCQGVIQLLEFSTTKYIGFTPVVCQIKIFRNNNKTENVI